MREYVRRNAGTRGISCRRRRTIRGARCAGAAAPARFPSLAERVCCSPPRGDQRASRRARIHWPFYLAREPQGATARDRGEREREAKCVGIVPTAPTRQIVSGCEHPRSGGSGRRPRSGGSGRPRSGVPVARGPGESSSDSHRRESETELPFLGVEPELFSPALTRDGPRSGNRHHVLTDLH